MSDEAAIRRANLNRLCKARGWGAKELHEAMGESGGSYSYWPNLLSNPAKSFGEKTARKIEEALELPRYWLDKEDEVPPEQSSGLERKRTLVVADALKSLGPTSRREALEFLRFKLIGENEMQVAEKLADYLADEKSSGEVNRKPS